MLSKKNSMVTMVTDEFLENRIILQKSVATIGFICFFWFQKCILLYIFAQVFLVMRSIRSHISLFRLGFTLTLRDEKWSKIKITYSSLIFFKCLKASWSIASMGDVLKLLQRKNVLIMLDTLCSLTPFKCVFYKHGNYVTRNSSGMCHLMPQPHLPEWREED